MNQIEKQLKAIEKYRHDPVYNGSFIIIELELKRRLFKIIQGGKVTKGVK